MTEIFQYAIIFTVWLINLAALVKCVSEKDVLFTIVFSATALWGYALLVDLYPLLVKGGV